MYAERARLGALGSFLDFRAGFSAFSAALRCEKNKGVLDIDDNGGGEISPNPTPPGDVEGVWGVYARR